MKPLLLDGGVIQPLEVRTSSRAVARLEDLALERAGRATSTSRFTTWTTPSGRGLAERLRARLPSLGQMVVSEVGAVIGARVGPGLLAVVVSPH